MRTAYLKRLSTYLAHAFVAIVALFPIVWGLLTSLKPSEEIIQFPPRILPQRVTLEHYQSIIETGVLGYTWNSIFVSSGTIVLCLGCAAIGAYALARFRFFGRGMVLALVVVVMSIPVASLLIPTYTMISEIGLVNTHLALILVYSAYQLPIVIWILAAYYQSLPEELEWSALIDGYSHLEVLWKVVLPLSKPGLVASVLFVITFAWNDFVVAVTLLSSDELRTLPIGIYNFLGFYGREWGPLLASSMVSIVPLIIVFVFLQRYFIAGMTGGGVKG